MRHQQQQEKISLTRFVMAWAALASSSTWAQAPIEPPNQERANYNHGWSIGVNVEYTDNVAHAADDEVGETSAAAFLRFDLGAARAKWEVSTAADLEYRTYFGGRLDNELSGGLNGQAQYRIIEDYWEVHVAEHYGQTRADRFQADSPNRRGYINEVSGGTGVSVPFGSRFALFGSGDYYDVTYEDSEADNTRTTGTAGMRQRFSERTFMHLSATRERVRLKDETADPTSAGDYDIEEASLGIDADLSRTYISASGGRTRVRSTVETPARTLFRLEIQRRFSSRSALTLSGGSEYEDTAQTFVRESPDVPVDEGGPNVNVTADPYKSDYGTLSYTYEGARYGIGLSSSLRHQRHEFNPGLNAKYLYTGLQLNATMSQRFQLYFRGSYYADQDDNTSSDQRVNDTRLRIGATFQPARSFTIEPYIESNSGNVEDSDYRENRVGIYIGYSPAVGR